MNQRPIRSAAAYWAVLGFSMLLLAAIWRLGQQSLAALQTELSTLEWTVLIAFCAFMLYSEGYRGFQQRYSPRFASRVIALRDSATLLEGLAAPLYAMGFFRAERRDMVVTYLLTLLIIAFIFLFGFIPQPWRGILDSGVVLGLGWGLISSWAHVLAAWRQPAPSTV